MLHVYGSERRIRMSLMMALFHDGKIYITADTLGVYTSFVDGSEERLPYQKVWQISESLAVSVTGAMTESKHQFITDFRAYNHGLKDFDRASEILSRVIDESLVLEKWDEFTIVLTGFDSKGHINRAFRLHFGENLKTTDHRSGIYYQGSEKGGAYISAMSGSVLQREPDPAKWASCLMEEAIAACPGELGLPVQQVILAALTTSRGGE